MAEDNATQFVPPEDWLPHQAPDWADWGDGDAPAYFGDLSPDEQRQRLEGMDEEQRRAFLGSHYDEFVDEGGELRDAGGDRPAKEARV